MDYVDRIEELTSENELLQMELGDLNRSLKKKDAEINFLINSIESAASLQSRIDMNLLEIEQLQYNMAAALKKNAGTELLNEELEISLLGEMREKHRQEAAIKSLGSVKMELDIVTGELEEAIPLYKRIEDLESTLAAARSTMSGIETENTDMKHELAELRELLTLIKAKKFE